jgi:hypothetical protein
VAKEMNRRRAAEQGIDLDKLRDPVKPEVVGRIIKGKLELPRERDRGGTVYRLAPERMDELGFRFGVPADEPTQLPNCNSHETATPENLDFDSASGDCGSCGSCGSSTEGGSSEIPF